MKVHQFSGLGVSEGIHLVQRKPSSESPNPVLSSIVLVRIRGKPTECLPRKRRSNGAKGTLDGSRRLAAGASEAQFATTRPVGQVVKTAASHAVNIGSNPVRVTKLSKDGKNLTSE